MSGLFDTAAMKGECDREPPSFCILCLMKVDIDLSTLIPVEEDILDEVKPGQ